MSTLLIRMTKPPYGSSDAEEGLDFAMAATNFGHEVKILFEGDGILQLLTNQQPGSMLNHGKRLKALSFFDIESCFICDKSIRALDLISSQLTDVATLISDKEKENLFKEVDHVVTF